MKIVILCVSLVIVGFIVIRVVSMVIFPHQRSREMLQDYVLNQTPLGMSMEDVITVIERHKYWDIYYIDY